MTLHWQANFQIPNSGTQARDVYVFIEEDGKTVKLYGNLEKDIFVSEKVYEFPDNVDPYDYLLSLDEFANYEKV